LIGQFHNVVTRHKISYYYGYSYFRIHCCYSLFSHLSFKKNYFVSPFFIFFIIIFLIILLESHIYTLICIKKKQVCKKYIIFFFFHFFFIFFQTMNKYILPFPIYFFQSCGHSLIYMCVWYNWDLLSDCSQFFFNKISPKIDYAYKDFCSIL
jgi:hypothetical protein